MTHGYDLIDISVPLADNAVSEPFPAKIEYFDHQYGGSQMQELFGVNRQDLSVSDGGGSVSYTHLTLPTTPYV